MDSYEPFIVYWRLYGGIKGLFVSIYFWSAVIITIACYPFWSEIDASDGKRAATELVWAIIPPLMAFALAGMAVVLALSGDKFTAAIREEGAPDSLFMKVVALFFHFLLVQTLTLILALLSRTYPEAGWIAGFTFFLMVYSISSGVAIAAMLLNISRIYNLTGGSDSDDGSDA